MSDSQIESFKVVLFGESGIGKASIILQFTDNTFQEDKLQQEELLVQNLLYMGIVKY